ncbi:LysR family transcriptional regulator [Paraperlucidibaca sp.]|uniref:LysR family transcriptional regulator n=1 Tax=Paraperlucidibaca sp. TaxID=2708021 RepID=UPI0030F477C8
MNKMNDQRQIDLNLYRVFAVVYRERSLTRAAEILCLSQSAVSHAIGRLRQSLDDPLFVREGQGVMPTVVADKLWPDIDAALNLLRLAAARSHDFDPQRDITQVTIAMNDELEPSLLPPLVAHLREQFLHAPDSDATLSNTTAVPISSVRLDRSNLRADLAARRLDIAIDVAQQVSPDIAHAALASDDFVVVARQPMKLTRERYFAAQHVIVSSRRTGRAVEDMAMAKLGFERQVVLRCQHYEAACKVVAASDCLLTMPRRQVRLSSGLAVMAMPLALPDLELHAYWHRQRETEPALIWLREQLFQALQT